MTSETAWPFVVRVFEGEQWVPLNEAVRLHEAHQDAMLEALAWRNSQARTLAMVARIVEAAGGEVTVPDRALMEDPTLVMTEDPLNNTRTYRVGARTGEPT